MGLFGGEQGCHEVVADRKKLQRGTCLSGCQSNQMDQ